MSNVYNENVVTRARANELVGRHWGKMLLMGLVIFLVVFAVTAVLGMVTTMVVGESVSSYSSHNSYSSYSTASTDGFGAASVLSLLTSLITTLISGALSLGYTASLISLANDEQVGVGNVFCRMNKCLSALGLSLWVGLKVFLWMLPGLGVALVGAVIGGLMESSGFMTLCLVIGYVLMLALMIRAAYSYAMSTYRMADEPDYGVFDSVRYSKAVMAGRRWQLFKLTIPYMLILIAFAIVLILVLSLLSSMGEGAFAIGSIVGVIAYLVLAVVLELRISMANVCFYLNIK